ncbi:MAG: hypothetical protein M1817_001640 [Caeruleum heppii]|nr:MAG: hypothetical protein M1817_001640 [Caeruleum heppii]
MDVFYAYTYGTAAWLCTQAVPLIASPTMIITMLSPEVREPTPLEEYFSRSLGIALITLAVINVLLTGSVPLTSSFADTAGSAATTTDAADPKAPYAIPTLSLTLTYHAAIAFYCYMRWNTTGVMGYAMGTLANGGLAAVGLWCLLFASSNGRISRKTLADKRTSGWPFGNREADKRKGKKI